MEDKLNLELVRLEEELEKLKTAVEYIESAKVSVEVASKIIGSMVDLQKEFEKLSTNSQILITKIDKVDFPSRLDKLDSTISTINQNISNLQARIESFERNVKDEIKSRSKDILQEFESNTKNLLGKSESNSKEIKLNRIVLLSLGIIIIIISVLIYLK